ncbi:MAG: hydrogenase iron-sulfur subunit [Candidatus Lokiarchaeota archaeon]|nr:hydrogenase iron-sulfur subunit [Candidatus Lokiarchaeota archaeon]
MKIGVFICHCGFNIAEVVDINELMEEIKDDEDLVLIDEDYVCSEQGLHNLKDKLTEENIDRVVIASCSPKVHELLFRNALDEVGINKYLLEIANIREQCSWVHHDEKDRATIKAADLIRASIEKVRRLEPIKPDIVPIKDSVLIIGGGVAGIKAALSLGEMGIKVYLVEREPSIGGHMAMFDKTFPTMDCSICILAPLMVEVSQNENVEVLTYSEVKEINGHVGDYKVKIVKKPRFVDESLCIGCIETCADVCPVEVEDEYNSRFSNRKAIYLQFPQAVPMIAVIDPESCIGCRACESFCDREAIDFEQKPEIIELNVGAIIVASGYDTFDPSVYSEYGYGIYRNVITGLEMERFLSPSGPTNGKILKPSNGEVAKRVAFIQCVGSRDESVDRPGCSRVCCMYAMKQAMEIRERVPDAEIDVYYIDIRAFGKGYEQFWQRIIKEYRVRFVRGRVSKIIKNPKNDNLIIKSENTLTNDLIKKEYDLVVLSVGLDPAKGLNKLANMLNISTDSEGFLLEDHPKLRTSESTVKGIYLAGCAQGPKDIQDSISHAESAALKAARLVKAGEVELDPLIAHIDQDKCIKCRLCQRTCDWKAIEYDKEEKIMKVKELNCVGCGTCAGACPTGAISIPGFTNEQISSQTEAILKEKRDFPLIVGFFCNWCSYAAADLAGTSKIQYPPNIRIIRVMCTGRISPNFILEAFSKGADGVLVAGCHPQDCHYRIGFDRMEKRVKALWDLFEDFGIDKKRLRIVSAGAPEAQKIADEITDFVKEIEELGPIGMEIKDEVP